MVALVIPGPEKHNDIDSFLYPLVQELKYLGTSGVDVFDAYQRERFILRVYPVVVTGR